MENSSRDSSSASLGKRSSTGDVPSLAGDVDDVGGEESLDSISPLKKQGSLSTQHFKKYSKETKRLNGLRSLVHKVKNTQHFVRSAKESIGAQNAGAGAGGVAGGSGGGSGITQMSATGQQRTAPAALKPIMEKIKKERTSELLKGKPTFG